MAESIVRLRVESQEYDAKLRRAAEGLTRFAEEVRKSGSTMESAKSDALNYVKAVGQMDTVSRTATGKLAEMKKTFTELSVQYKQLTDAEKQSPYGKALSASLDQLRVRITESKKQLDEVNQSLQDTSSKGGETSNVLSKLAGKFGLNITQAGALGAALGVASAAAKVAKDAFFANEQQLDEWGRTVAASESVYRGFLDTLNTGDISGFLSRMSSIVSAAREAYDAMDELNTYNAFNQINVEKTRHKLSESINDFREGSGSKENVKTAGDAVIEELRTRQKYEQKVYDKAVKELARQRGVSERDLRDVLTGKWGTYEELKGLGLSGTRQVWRSSGVSTTANSGRFVNVAAPGNRREELGAALRRINDEADLKRIQAIGAQVERTNQESDSVERQVIRTMNARIGGGSISGGRITTGKGGGGVANVPPPSGSIAEQEAKVQALTKAWKNATDQAGREGYAAQLNEAKKLLDEMQGKKVEIVPDGSFKDLNNQLKELQAQRELLTDPIDVAVNDEMIQQVKDDIDRLNGKTIKVTVQNTMSVEEQVRTKISDQNIEADINTLRNLIEVKIRKGLDDIDIPTQYLEQAIFGEQLNIPDEYWQSFVDQMNERLREMKLDPIKLEVDTGNIVTDVKKLKEGWKDAASAIQSVGSALAMIENPAAKVLGTIAQAIASVALAAGQAMAAKDTTSSGWAWIGAAAAITATMVSTISAIHSATGFAEGGIVRGNTFSGDQIPAFLNAGEVVLNRAQQGVIADALGGGRAPVIQIEGVIDGETIRLAQRNNNRRTGRGEYVTTKTR